MNDENIVITEVTEVTEVGRNTRRAEERKEKKERKSGQNHRLRRRFSDSGLCCDGAFGYTSEIAIHVHTDKTVKRRGLRFSSRLCGTEKKRRRSDRAHKRRLQQNVNKGFLLPRYDLYETDWNIGLLLLRTFFINGVDSGNRAVLHVLFPALRKRAFKFAVFGLLVCLLFCLLPAWPGTFHGGRTRTHALRFSAQIS